MEAGTTPTTFFNQHRPYRSHKIPACERCRQRKIRCNVDLEGQPCQFCRERGLLCTYSEGRLNDVDHDVRGGGATIPQIPAKRSRPSAGGEGNSNAFSIPASRETGLSQYPSVSGTSPTESSLIMGPAVAEDIEILERYLTSRMPVDGSNSKPYHLISSAPGNSIVYLTLPRRRKGLQSAVDPGKHQREIMEQILGPWKENVVQIYFQYLHPSFPILDEKTFSDLWRRDTDRISSTLVCEIYASALHLWNRSDVLKLHPQPDVNFAWNQAVAALQDDFMAPSISTVHCALIDMVGRPVLYVRGNIINAGRTVTLAHSLGLHRDPSSWKATPHEKKVRIRLWWGVLIHDHWSSIAHGIPPNIYRDRYDVPLPSSACLASAGTSEYQKKAIASFQQLCALTQILGDVLPVVYTLKLNHDEIWRTLRRLECALDDWEAALPDYLRVTSSESSFKADGSSNLRFCFLSIKLLLCRLALRATMQSPERTRNDAKRYRLAMLRESASDLTDFICSLSEIQLQEFWLPYTAHLLVSATTILLRCTVETPETESAQTCVSKLLLLQARLQAARDSQGWDLAEFCLERCQDAITRVANGFSQQQNTAPIAEDAATANADGTCQADGAEGLGFLTPSAGDLGNIFVPVDSLDYPWETLWDTLEGPYGISI